MEIYFKGRKQVFADYKGFTIKTDQSVGNEGDGEFPEPFDLFLVSLGTCAGIYVKGFCDKRGIPSDKIRLSQQQFDPERKIIGFIDIKIHVPADFPKKYESAFLQSAKLCTVKRHLRDDIEVKVQVVSA
jgi:ribosomal protein S12 methylthiotransferase accessory factor